MNRAHRSGGCTCNPTVLAEHPADDGVDVWVEHAADCPMGESAWHLNQLGIYPRIAGIPPSRCKR